MAKRVRSRGTKLYAVRGKNGRFKDIQSYKRKALKVSKRDG